MLKLVDGEFRYVDEPALSALNMRLRDDYLRDCNKGVGRWNTIIQKAGIDFTFELPHQAFHRKIGLFSDTHTSPTGEVMSEAEWSARQDEWLPTKEDGDFINSLMTPVMEPGEFAGWIAPPKVGIDNKPGDFEYVQVSE